MTRDLLRAGIGVLRRRPAQSALTILGLTIGVAAFIAMVSFGQGARMSVIAQFEALGSNLIRVDVANVQETRGRAAHQLTDADVEAIRRESTSIASGSGVLQRSADATREGRHDLTTVYGTSPHFAELHEWGFTLGGMFDELDLARRAKVCVVGATIVRELFGNVDPLGRSITVLGGLSCNVVGVLSPKGHSTSGHDLDDVVFVPLSTLRTFLGEATGYSYVEVEPLTPDLMETGQAELKGILRRSHHLDAGEPDDFRVSSPLEVVRAVGRTISILSRLLQSVAAISLLVGGIGVMNIQLVSVAERTEEIGIRAAIGASPRQILRQFLAEAGMLSVSGSLLGVIAGIAISAIVAARMGWPRVVSPVGVAGSALFGISVGILFGYLPARRASDLDPVQALRHE